MTVTCVGGALLIVAILALLSSQPRVVWYSAALTGGLCFILGLAMMRLVRRRYAEAELRKIHAADAGRPLAPRIGRRRRLDSLAAHSIPSELPRLAASHSLSG